MLGEITYMKLVKSQQILIISMLVSLNGFKDTKITKIRLDSIYVINYFRKQIYWKRTLLLNSGWCFEYISRCLSMVSSCLSSFSFGIWNPILIKLNNLLSSIYLWQLSVKNISLVSMIICIAPCIVVQVAVINKTLLYISIQCNGEQCTKYLQNFIDHNTIFRINNWCVILSKTCEVYDPSFGWRTTNVVLYDPFFGWRTINVVWVRQYQYIMSTMYLSTSHEVRFQVSAVRIYVHI